MKQVHVLIAASLAVAVFAGMYAAASVGAATIVAGFSGTEATSHEQNVAFAVTLKQAIADHRAARARCKTMARAEREACNAAAFNSHTW